MGWGSEYSIIINMDSEAIIFLVVILIAVLIFAIWIMFTSNSSNIPRDVFPIPDSTEPILNVKLNNILSRNLNSIDDVFRQEADLIEYMISVPIYNYSKTNDLTSFDDYLTILETTIDYTKVDEKILDPMTSKQVAKFMRIHLGLERYTPLDLTTNEISYTIMNAFLRNAKFTLPDIPLEIDHAPILKGNDIEIYENCLLVRNILRVIVPYTNIVDTANTLDFVKRLGTAYGLAGYTSSESYTPRVFYPLQTTIYMSGTNVSIFVTPTYTLEMTTNTETHTPENTTTLILNNVIDPLVGGIDHNILSGNMIVNGGSCLFKDELLINVVAVYTHLSLDEASSTTFRIVFARKDPATVWATYVKFNGTEPLAFYDKNKKRITGPIDEPITSYFLGAETEDDKNVLLYDVFLDEDSNENGILCEYNSEMKLIVMPASTDVVQTYLLKSEYSFSREGKDYVATYNNISQSFDVSEK